MSSKGSPFAGCLLLIVFMALTAGVVLDQLSNKTTKPRQPSDPSFIRKALGIKQEETETKLEFAVRKNDEEIKKLKRDYFKLEDDRKEWLQNLENHLATGGTKGDEITQQWLAAIIANEQKRLDIQASIGLAAQQQKKLRALEIGYKTDSLFSMDAIDYQDRGARILAEVGERARKRIAAAKEKARRERLIRSRRIAAKLLKIVLERSLTKEERELGIPLATDSKEIRKLLYYDQLLDQVDPQLCKIPWGEVVKYGLYRISTVPQPKYSFVPNHSISGSSRPDPKVFQREMILKSFQARVPLAKAIAVWGKGEKRASKLLDQLPKWIIIETLKEDTKSSSRRIGHPVFTILSAGIIPYNSVHSYWGYGIQGLFQNKEAWIDKPQLVGYYGTPRQVTIKYAKRSSRETMFIIYSTNGKQARRNKATTTINVPQTFPKDHILLLKLNYIKKKINAKWFSISIKTALETYP